MKYTLTFSLLSMLAICSSQAADPLPVSKDYWKSDAFRKAFNGSYRINARIEPFVDSKERALLVELQGLMAKGQRTKGLDLLKKSPLLQTSAAIMFNAGNIAYESGNHEYATKMFTGALKKFPTFLRAQQNLAVVYAQQGDYDKAFPHLLEAVRLGSQDGMVTGLLGYCYQQKENYSSALQAFKNAQITDPQNIEWKRGEAYCHDQMGDLEKALKLYQEVVKARPNEHNYALRLVNLYQRLDRGEDAIILLELLRRKGALEDVDKLLLGQLHLQVGSKKLGAQAIREALQSGKLKNMDAALEVILFSLDRGELKLAKEFYALTKVDAIGDAATKHLHQRLGAQIALVDETLADKSFAVETLKSLIRTTPLDADSLYLLAGYEAVTGNKEKALLLYDQALKGEGVYQSRALLEKGKLLVELKHYKRALKALTEYAKVDESPSVRNYIKAVKALSEASQ